MRGDRRDFESAEITFRVCGAARWHPRRRPAVTAFPGRQDRAAPEAQENLLRDLEISAFSAHKAEPEPHAAPADGPRTGGAMGAETRAAAADPFEPAARTAALRLPPCKNPAIATASSRTPPAALPQQTAVFVRSASADHRVRRTIRRTPWPRLARPCFDGVACNANRTPPPCPASASSPRPPSTASPPAR